MLRDELLHALAVNLDVHLLPFGSVLRHERLQSADDIVRIGVCESQAEENEVWTCGGWEKRLDDRFIFGIGGVSSVERDEAGEVGEAMGHAA